MKIFLSPAKPSFPSFFNNSKQQMFFISVIFYDNIFWINFMFGIGTPALKVWLQIDMIHAEFRGAAISLGRNPTSSIMLSVTLTITTYQSKAEPAILQASIHGHKVSLSEMNESIFDLYIWILQIIFQRHEIQWDQAAIWDTKQNMLTV